MESRSIYCEAFESMQARNISYLVASILAAVCAAGLIVSFVAMEYRVAWAFVVALIICAEVRVQVGERLPRRGLFLIHIFSAIPLFFALTALAFFFQALWLEVVTAAFGIAVLATGTILWHRGVRNARALS